MGEVWRRLILEGTLQNPGNHTCKLLTPGPCLVCVLAMFRPKGFWKYMVESDLEPAQGQGVEGAGPAGLERKELYDSWLNFCVISF